MAKFEVLVFGSTFAEAVIEVDAVDADAAHEAAMKRAATDKTIKWKREEPTTLLSEIDGVVRGMTDLPPPSFDDNPYLTPEENLKVNQEKAEMVALLDAYNSVELTTEEFEQAQIDRLALLGEACGEATVMPPEAVATIALTLVVIAMVFWSA